MPLLGIDIFGFFGFLACFFEFFFYFSNLGILMNTELWENIPLTFSGNSKKNNKLFRLKSPAKILFSLGQKSRFNLRCQVFFQILKI
jgi:hypothetical protein